LTELQEQFDELTKANELIMRQKARLHEESLKTKKDLNTLESLFGRLKDSFQQLTVQKDALDRDNDSLRKQLAAKIQAAPEYQALDKQAKSLQNSNQSQANQIKDLSAKLKTATDRIAKIQGRDRQFAKQIQGYQKAAEKMKAENTKLAKTNQDLNKILSSMPANVKDLASQNKKLTRETAEMHYNMGVFFTENRKYELAVREFTRTLQIDPNHAKAHYNLGYLYSERYERHDEAIGHFRSYLQLNPTGREAELIRSYLLQREVFDDKPKEGVIKGKGIA
jgi:tetratricopeptide (TPR) repeat protein